MGNKGDSNEEKQERLKIIGQEISDAFIGKNKEPDKIRERNEESVLTAFNIVKEKAPPSIDLSSNELRIKFYEELKTVINCVQTTAESGFNARMYKYLKKSRALYFIFRNPRIRGFCSVSQKKRIKGYRLLPSCSQFYLHKSPTRKYKRGFCKGRFLRG